MKEIIQRAVSYGVLVYPSSIKGSDETVKGNIALGIGLGFVGEFCQYRLGWGTGDREPPFSLWLLPEVNSSTIDFKTLELVVSVVIVFFASYSVFRTVSFKRVVKIQLTQILFANALVVAMVATHWLIHEK